MYHETYTCSHCGRPVSKTDTRCPHCGVHFSGVRQVNPTPAVRSSKPAPKGCVAAVIAGFALICIVGAVLISQGAKSDNTSRAATAPIILETDGRVVETVAIASTQTAALADIGENLYERALAGEFRGREVSLLTWGDPSNEAEPYTIAAQSFSEQTGIDVSVELVDLTQTELANRILTDISSGSAADIVVFEDPVIYEQVGSEGHLLDIRNLLGDKLLQERYDEAWLERATLATADGRVLAGLWRTYLPGQMVFYASDNFSEAGYALPETWEELIALSDQIVTDGGTPWCVGLENTTRAEWLATSWLEDILLRTQPMKTYHALVSGELGYDAPEVQDAFALLSSIWQHEDYVFLDPDASESSWWEGIGRGLFTEPPKCWMLADRGYLADLFEQQGIYGEEFDWFILPPIDAKYGQPQIVWGELLAATSGRPEVVAMLDYLTRTESLSPWLQDSTTLSALKDTPLDAYTSAFQRSLAERQSEATNLVMEASLSASDEHEQLQQQIEVYIQTALGVASGPPPVERTGHIIDLVNEGSILVQATGNGIDGLDLDIENLIDELLNVEIPAGTYFVSNTGGEQNMVVRHSKVVQVEPNDLLSTLLDAACAEMQDDVPGDETGFTIQRQGTDDLARLMTVLDAAYVDYDVEQAAIWIVTNNADYYDLGTLVSGWGNARVILEDEAAQAMRLVDEAGLNITYYAIWNDREMIINGASAEQARWLRERVP